VEVEGEVEVPDRCNHQLADVDMDWIANGNDGLQGNLGWVNGGCFQGPKGSSEHVSDASEGCIV
jgi:hypothetical protein